MQQVATLVHDRVRVVMLTVGDGLIVRSENVTQPEALRSRGSQEAVSAVCCSAYESRRLPRTQLRYWTSFTPIPGIGDLKV